MNLNLKVWRQKDQKSKGEFQEIKAENISEHSSFLEMLDVVNEKIEEEIPMIRSVLPKEEAEKLGANIPASELAHRLLDGVIKSGRGSDGTQTLFSDYCDYLP